MYLIYIIYILAHIHADMHVFVLWLKHTFSCGYAVHWSKEMYHGFVPLMN